MRKKISGTDVENCITGIDQHGRIQWIVLGLSEPFFTPVQHTIESGILPLVLKLMGTIYIIMEGMNRHLAVS